VLLIPGGMGETEGGKGIERQVLDLLAAQPPATRPVLVGNNSLGIVSRPARFDSFFIPEDKLPRVEQGKTLHRVAFISQSGAFMLTQLGKHQFVRPDYQVSIGNQIDARASHFVEALAEERELRTFALYVEGLKPGDGERLARVVRDVARERDVIVYKAGRSSLGQAATMGHTASIAGDYRVFRDVLADAGALVAESFAEFYDLVGLSAALGDKRFGGGRVALLSNAGYEVVGMADNHRGSRYALEPAQLAPETVTSIEQALEKARIAALINVKNPLDLTPMANDEVHDACARALLADPGVDLAVLGNVPFTPAVQSLPHGVSERDVFDAEGSYANRMVELFGSSDKPFVVVIDAGGYYDPMCDHMRAAGVPVFRDADRATRALGRYAALRLRQQGA